MQIDNKQIVMAAPVFVALIIVLAITVMPTQLSLPVSSQFYYAPPPVSPPNYPEIRESVIEVESLLETVSIDELLTGVSPTVVGSEYDQNNDGIVDVADAFLILRGSGAIKVDPPVLDPTTAGTLLATLEAIFGPGLQNFPTVEGRIYLLYMLAYLPQH